MRSHWLGHAVGQWSLRTAGHADRSETYWRTTVTPTGPFCPHSRVFRRQPHPLLSPAQGPRFSYPCICLPARQHQRLFLLRLLIVSLSTDCPVPSAQSACCGAWPAGPARNKNANFLLPTHGSLFLHLRPSMGALELPWKFRDNWPPRFLGISEHTNKQTYRYTHEQNYYIRFLHVTKTAILTVAIRQSNLAKAASNPRGKWRECFLGLWESSPQQNLDPCRAQASYRQTDRRRDHRSH